jgi:hypothetical protein
MRMLIADSAGTGVLQDHEGGTRELSADSWTETDARDVIVATTGTVYVRYRGDGHTVEVAAGQTYHLELPENEDVIDVRTATDAGEQIVDVISGAGAGADAHAEQILNALAMAPHDHSRGPWIEQLRFIVHDRSGRDLDDVLSSELGGADLDRAQELLR